tara:strand:+ start:2534 stop:3553 length:1020 start_codon:yes stop_codon:yes gene_type:complete
MKNALLALLTSTVTATTPSALLTTSDIAGATVDVALSGTDYTITITGADVTRYNGVYGTTVAAITAGPVFIVNPIISNASLTVGDTATGSGGVVVSAADQSAPVMTYDWLLGGVSQGSDTATFLTTTTGSLTFQQRASISGGASTTVTSAAVTVAAAGAFAYPNGKLSVVSSSAWSVFSGGNLSGHGDEIDVVSSEATKTTTANDWSGNVFEGETNPNFVEVTGLTVDATAKLRMMLASTDGNDFLSLSLDGAGVAQVSGRVGGSWGNPSNDTSGTTVTYPMTAKFTYNSGTGGYEVFADGVSILTGTTSTGRTGKASLVLMRTGTDTVTIEDFSTGTE